jgi:hypothetical protein
MYRSSAIVKQWTDKEGTYLKTEEDCRMAMVWIALLGGGDYAPEGLTGFGKLTTKCNLSKLINRSDHHLRPRQCRNGRFSTSLQSWSTDQRSRCRQSTRPHDRRITNQRLRSFRSTISRQSSRTASQSPLNPLPCVRSRRIPPPSYFVG